MTDTENGAVFREDPGITLEAIGGQQYWKEVLLGLVPGKELDDYLGLRKRACICLTGRAGVGKRTLARGFAGSARTRGYAFFRLTDGMLRTVRKEERRALIRGVFAAAGSSPSVLMLEPQGKETFWRAAADGISCLPVSAPIVVVIVEDDPTAVRREGIPDLMVFSVDVPDQESREVFFAAAENRLIRGRNSLGEAVPTAEQMAFGTEDLTYTELQQVVRMIRLRLKQQALVKCGGDAGAALRELEAARVYCSTELFLETVQAVKQAQEATAALSAAAVVPEARTEAAQDTAEVSDTGSISGFSQNEEPEPWAGELPLGGEDLTPEEQAEKVKKATDAFYEALYN